MSESPRQEADDSTSPTHKEVPECPTCGRDDFASERGMKQHHAKVHDESIAGTVLECEWCGKEYKKYPPLDERSTYCSNQCQGKAKTANKTQLVECANCGEEIRRNDCNIKGTDRYYCNQQCHGEWLEGENHHNWKGGNVTVECCVCGDTKEVPPSQAKSEDRHFCYEKGCRYDWISENHSGEDHPFWKGGVRENYLGSWQKQRRKARERDDNQCRACGMTNEEHKQEYGKSLQVHHIKPARTFDDPEDAHELENLVTACAACHASFEGLPVFPHRNK